MNWDNVPVLVTGAGGFIGSQLTEALAAAGARVTAFVRYNSSGDDGLLRLAPPELRARINIFRGDVRDPEAVRRATRGVDTVFHLAALIAIPYSYLNPREVIETNVMGTLNVLEAGRDAKVRRIVHTSTSEVFGTARYVPIDEAHPLQGQSPYSASKIGADKVAESYYCAFDAPVVTLRPFNTYGPRQSARAVIPTIITQALVRDTVHLGSLTPTRDFTFVADTVRAFMAAAAHDDAVGREINLGVGKTISIGELAETIFRLMGKEPRIQCDEARQRPEKSEVLRLLSSNRLAAELIGWQPAVSLDDGLRRTIDWIAANLNLYQPERYTV